MFNLRHMRTTWIKETKFTTAFKRGENQSFRSNLLQSISTSLPWAVFLLTLKDTGPGQGSDACFRTPGRYTPPIAEFSALGSEWRLQG